MTIFRKVIKVILWVVISFMLLLIVIAIVIQIPSIQNKIVHYATSFISNKPHTIVSIKNISISFPKSIAIEGLYFGDTNKDTLIYAEKTKIDIAFKNLLDHRILINSFYLENVTLNLKRKEKDSLYNYNFLITAFSDTSKHKMSEPDKKSDWTFSIKYVSLKNIHFNYIDEYGGVIANVYLNNLDLRMELIDIDKSMYKIDKLRIDNSYTKVLITKSDTTEEVNSQSVLPTITANKIQINNTNLNYADSTSKLNILANLNLINLQNASIDLQKQNVTIDNINLSNSKIRYKYRDDIPERDVISATSNDNAWKVNVENIDLGDNLIAYNVANKPEIKDMFDANHLEINHLTLKAKNFIYTPQKTEVSIKQLNAVDQNKFSIRNVQTDFSMDQHSINVRNFKVKTTHSYIDADLKLKYSSIQSMKDSIQNLFLNANMKNVSIMNSDILYFYSSSQLKSLDFFKNVSNITTISGIIDGPVINLKGEKVVIHTGANTNLQTDFIIAGLPSYDSSYFDLPDLEINSVRKDILMILGSSVPETMELPESINMKIVFKGKLRSFESTLSMNSSYGAAHLWAVIDRNENFKSKLDITNLDVGSLMKNKEMYGPVSLTAEATGQGLDIKTIKAEIKAEVSQVYFNKYTYQKLNINGSIAGKSFEGKVNLKDENAEFDFDGLVNLNPNDEHYKFDFDLHGADLKKLNFTKNDLRIAFEAKGDIKGESFNKITGNAGIRNIIISHEGKKYILDSLLFTSINESNKNDISISSAIVGIKYNGTLSPMDLTDELEKFINNYFPINVSHQKDVKHSLNANFEIQLHNHPILSEVFFPELKGFEPGIIKGSFDSQKKELKIDASIKRIVYGSMEMKDISVDVTSDINAINYKASCGSISNSMIKLDNFLFSGKLADKEIFASVSSINDKNKKLLINSKIIMDGDNYKLMLDPKDFYLMNNRWDIAADNYVEFGKQGFMIRNLFLRNAESNIKINSVNNKFNDDIKIEISKLKLDDISGIIEKDSALVRGIVDGNILLKRVRNTYGLIADAKISNLVVREVPIGNLSLKAENPTTEKFNIDLNLSGKDNNLSLNGYLIPMDSNSSVNIKAKIQSLSMKTVEAFSMGYLTKASGNITGDFLIDGSTQAYDITGELVFNDAFITPAILQNQLQLKHETIQLKKEGIYFKSFTILDDKHNIAKIDGSVQMQHFNNIIYDLRLTANDFLLFNTKAKDNKEFYGKMVLDSKIDITGPMTLPVISANIKLKKGSNFTFAVPETELNTDKGEDVVEFNDSLNLNRILFRNESVEKHKSVLTGYDIACSVEIEKEAVFKLLPDPASTDSLVAKGEAALSFTIDKSGTMSLTGEYNLNEGSYMVSLESVLKRKFKIEKGGTLTWDGDPLGEQMSIDAVYSLRASPIDLVADQMTGLSETEKGGYKQLYTFLVTLKLRGQMMHPEISFAINLQPQDKGILGGAVNAKLDLLNEDASALNKQVFALLVLGRFLQENPLQTESDASAAGAVRGTVGKILSAQLNKWSSKMVPGVELNFDIQSYNDYSSGQIEGRTQIGLGVKKQLLNERLSVQVGGSVDVEGQKANQNSASEITSDVTLEYNLTKDGRYRLKGFRLNQYEDPIVGQLLETGIGIIYVLDFNKWKELFK